MNEKMKMYLTKSLGQTVTVTIKDTLSNCACSVIAFHIANSVSNLQMYRYIYIYIKSDRKRIFPEVRCHALLRFLRGQSTLSVVV